MAKLLRDEGVVLAREAFGEADLLTTLFTRNHGVLVLRASRERGASLVVPHRVEVLCEVWGEHPVLKEARLLRGFSRVQGAVDRAEAARQGLALARELLPEGEAQPQAYALVLSFLQTLEGGVPPKRVLLGFLLHLAELLGCGPYLEGCRVCGAAGGLTWSAERGGLLCRACGGEGEEVSSEFWRYLLAFKRLPVWAAGRVALGEKEVEGALLLVRAFLSQKVRR